MAITELTNSRTITYNEGSPVGTREYYAYPYANEKLVFDEFNSGALPNKMTPWPSVGFFMPFVDLYVYDMSLRHDPNVPEGWFVTLTYRERVDGAITPNLAPNDAGYVSMRMSFATTFEDAWRQWNTEAALNDEAGTAKLDDFYRPIYKVGTLNSDIGGIKIDVAGNPTSVMRHSQRMQVDVVSNIAPSPITYRNHLGTRNLTPFLGCVRGTAVFVGAEGTVLSPGKWMINFNFDIDFWYHLKQVPKRHQNGAIVLDVAPGTDDGVGNAKIVSWVQPFPIGTEFRRLIPYFTTLP